LPEIPDRERALNELRRVLKPRGILSVTEEFLDPDYPLARTTLRRTEEAGFELEERHGNWWIYTLNFRKPMQKVEKKHL
jgi:ubiquinone/menaquinone biosynthesis C-methylase UbiE